MLHNYAAYHLTNIGEVIYRIIMQHINLTDIGEVDMLHNYAVYDLTDILVGWYAA